MYCINKFNQIDIFDYYEKLEKQEQEQKENVYGIDKYDLLVINHKINKQKTFLEKSYFINSSGEAKSFFDINMSANLSKNYYYEVVNRVNSFNYNNVTKNNKPIFITATLNAPFHTQEYEKFNKDDLKSLKAKLTEKKYDSAYLKYKLNKKLNNNNLKDILNYQFKLFSSALNRDIKKYTLSKRCEYIRVLEPHKKSGVPHLHALIYIPNDEKVLNRAKELFKKYFYAPQNLRADKNKLTLEQIKSGDLNGFQTCLTNSTGYILKYITKTFKNLSNHDSNEDIKLDRLECWYIKNKIRRFMTSRYKFPISLYRKISFIENLRCFDELQNFVENKENYFSWDLKNNIFYCSIKELSIDICMDKDRLRYYLANYKKLDYHKVYKTSLYFSDKSLLDCA